MKTYSSKIDAIFEQPFPSRSAISAFIKIHFPHLPKSKRHLIGKIIEGVNWKNSKKVGFALVELFQ